MGDGGASPQADVLAGWVQDRAAKDVAARDAWSLQVAREARLRTQALEFVVTVGKLNDMAELAASLRSVLASYGMTAAASGLVSGVKAGSANPFHFADWPKDWVAYYTDNKLMVIDPVLRWARNSGAPLTWSDLHCTLSPRDPGYRVFEASRRFGFSEGMVVPMRSSDNRLGVVSFGGPRGQISPADQGLLGAVARCAFEAAERIETKGYVGRPAAILSAREIECLAILVRGHSDQQLAKLLGLSIPTVRFHLANARDKLGAKSRTHLAALAVAQGYVCL